MKNKLIKKIAIFGSAAILSLTVGCSTLRNTLFDENIVNLGNGYSTDASDLVSLGLISSFNDGSIEYTKRENGEYGLTFPPERMITLNIRGKKFKNLCQNVDTNRDRFLNYNEISKFWLDTMNNHSVPLKY
ncbi:MAG: hypothetical protein AABW47_04605 [Nanoarchaeota archaeon]